MNKIIKCLVATSLMLIFAGCGTLPQVKAQERIFPPLALEFLAEYDLPLQEFANTPVGGLSGITYDRQTNRFFAVSDDRSNLAPARFYTLDLEIAEQANQQIGIKNIKIEDVTFLRDAEGKTYSPGTIDPEGIALSPQGSLYISSEGSPQLNIPPGIFEFDKNTGKLKQGLRIPQRYLPDPTG
ncbi:MAG: esterase-like activity of phytase family protein, partial [Cyanobacteria bacterium J083]